MSHEFDTYSWLQTAKLNGRKLSKLMVLAHKNKLTLKSYL